MTDGELRPADVDHPRGARGAAAVRLAEFVIPVVVGELLAGIALGKTGAGLVKADDPTIAFLGNLGFAMLMLVAGMHVPLRNRGLLGSLRRGDVAVAAERRARRPAAGS